MTTTALPAARAAGRAAALPWYVAAALVAATSAKVGGIWAIQLGALFLVLSLQNRDPAEEPPRLYGLLAAYMIAILLQNVATIGIEQVGFANLAHNAVYYKVAAGGVPFLLVAAGRGIRLRWPTTTAAACYMAFSLVLIWILQLAPATPKLAPVFNP